LAAVEGVLEPLAEVAPPSPLFLFKLSLSSVPSCPVVFALLASISRP